MTQEQVDIQVLVGEYKNIAQQIEMLEDHKIIIREQILQACDHQEFEGYGLKITHQEATAVLDWKTALKALKIPQEELQPFYKEKPGYFRFTLKRCIAL